jgi:RNA polymerase sigma-70 factor (ECF subfamily)
MNGLPVTNVLPILVPADHAERLAELFDTHHERLYRLARRLTTTADDALDLVQDTFLKAARSPGSVPVGFGNEEAWLVRVLINTRRDQWRRDAVRRRHDAQGPAVDNPPADPEAALMVRTAVWRALDGLAPRRRAVIVMYELEGLAIPAIARLLGIGAVTVRWHLSRGRRDLAAALRHELGERDDHR